MTKGRPATQGIKDAIAIARKRGCVMKIEYGLESTCDFLIRTMGYITFAKLRRMDRITATASGIAHEFRGIIEALRLFPASKQILLEIWIYSKHGTFRFFRIVENGLVEIAMDGGPVPVPVPAESPIVVPVSGKTTTTQPVVEGMAGADPDKGTTGEENTSSDEGGGRLSHPPSDMLRKRVSLIPARESTMENREG